MGVGKLPDVVNGYNWELYNIADDYSEYNDLAAKMPDKLRDMQELFLVEAEKNNVFPLDNDVLGRALAPRPSSTAGRTTFTYTNEVSGLPAESAPSTLGKSFSITAEVEIPPGGAEGMINTNGGRFGGWSLFGQGQAGFHLRRTHHGTLPLGKSQRSPARQAHHRI
jgi:arylsulfatase